MKRDFWNGKRVFVTGHTGFFGGWLSLWLDHMGADVTGYSLAPPTRPNFFEAVGLSETISSITGDIRKLNVLSGALRECSPEIVFHLAAQPLVRTAHDSPVETFATNVMGTVNVLQAIRTCPEIGAAIICTTDKVYENVETETGYREEDRLGGREPYGASKACAEIAVAAFRQSYMSSGPSIASVRAGNIIGGGDWAADRLVPDAVRAFGAGNSLSVRNPDAVRPWQHVLDPARGMLLLAQRMIEDKNLPTSWNLGPSEDMAASVEDLLNLVVQEWGNSAGWDADRTHSGPYEAKLLRIDSSLAGARLPWKPAWSLERAVKATVDWYQAHLTQKDMKAFSLAQITAMEGAN